MKLMQTKTDRGHPIKHTNRSKRQLTAQQKYTDYGVLGCWQV